MTWLARLTGCLAVCMLLVTSAPAQTAVAPALLKALQKGGNVIVMRHASSPLKPPTAATAARGNFSQERQLDEAGRKSAKDMGKALRDLNIPLGMVLSSKAYRALETALYMDVPEPKAYKELTDYGQAMQPVSPQQAAWLRELAQMPVTDKNMLVITHKSYIEAAFPQYAGNMADGEALVLGKDAKGVVVALGRIRIEEWTTLAQGR
jgi:phosphohistidine phosphatase SixA